MERKKIVCLSLLFFVTLFANAQTQRLYNAIVKKDKFDDVIWRKNAKTLVTKTDTTFIVETKGQKPVEYGYISVEPFYTRVGSKDSLISIAKDVYGFDDQYVVMTRDVAKQLGKEMVSGYEELPDTFTYDDVVEVRRQQNLSADKTRYMLNNWKTRGYIVRDPKGQKDVWVKCKGKTHRNQ